jgi:transcriptional regulator with XRE-family HTH domain
MTIQRAEVVPEWTFGDRVRRIRRSEGLSQAEMAMRLGVQPKALGNWEADVAKPRDIFAIAKAIEAVFGVRRTWTLGLLDGPDDGGSSLLRQDSNLEPAVNRRFLRSAMTGLRTAHWFDHGFAEAS